MELTPARYYNQQKFPHTYYLTMMSLETFFGRELFKGETSRVFYASPEYCFRRRLDMLNHNAAQDFHSLDFPFMSYYRKNNWVVDRARPAVEDTHAASIGYLVDNLPVRFMNVKADFTGYLIFSRDDEAQVAYETLLWMKHPTAKQYAVKGLAYKNIAIDIPIQMSFDDLRFNPQYKEMDWLKRNRMITIEFDFSIRSVILAPIAQGTTSELFETTEDPSSAFYITKEVYLDFFATKNIPYPDEAFIEDIVTGEFENDPTLEAIFNHGDITNTSIVLDWDYSAASEKYYETDVRITNNMGLNVLVPMANKTYVASNLNPNSTYEFIIWFYSKNSYINKYSMIVTTAAEDWKPLSLKPV